MREPESNGREQAYETRVVANDHLALKIVHRTVFPLCHSAMLAERDTVEPSQSDAVGYNPQDSAMPAPRHDSCKSLCQRTGRMNVFV